jgi:membrane-bound lytic murein transglycosylase D
VKRSLDRGRSGDFFSLDLVTETREYVPKLLALRRLVGNPEAYGLRFAAIPNQPYFTIVDPGRQVRLDEVAELAAVPKDEVLALNPAFNRMSTPPNGPHRLLLPLEAAGTYAQAIAEGREPTVRQAALVYHSVRRGENLTSIARRYGVSPAELRAANGLSGSTIQPGQQLLVPVAAGSAAGGAALASVEARPDLGNQLPERQVAAAPRKPTRHLVKPGESLWSVARLHGVSVPELAAENGMSSKAQINTGQSLRIPRSGSANTRLAARDGDAVRTTYRVRRGDTLSGIARRFDVTVQQIKDWNDLPSSNTVKAGQRLVVYVGADRVRGG